ncbi:hypothetical protein DFQ11_102414 [Winogradskyella epiphytica]|uniref:Uncharacterized protein n=1 Tax=Winogradskyella epiphytica TaxID=262005 RepID=A0A2V4YEC5_9FLAO|nr:hypothetical protein [Winogradskyella epiphytica]PYE81837.1 hypothetical protein DFQ11_102414 [Winogradskyella epiphytica]GGW62305.1 hypothetical protein GCM10008085_12560 [Winogradskyella epiphytica]
MKKFILIVFALFIGLNVYGQRRRNMNNIPQTNREPTEQEIAKFEREREERKQEYIANFLTTLEADDFQKEIIKQHLNSYYEAKMALYKMRFEREFKREKAIKNLDDTHFSELKDLISEGDMLKIKDMIQGDFNEKEVVKKKRKNKKKKNRKKD